MALPTAEVLANGAFRESILKAMHEAPTTALTLKDLLPKPPKFRRSREVHARRASKLRRRGEYVHFVRWEHGHCIYSWSGPVSQTFTFRMPQRGVDHE